MPLAPHVQAALARALQAKLPEPPRAAPRPQLPPTPPARALAAHVQAAMAGPRRSLGRSLDPRTPALQAKAPSRPTVGLPAASRQQVLQGCFPGGASSLGRPALQAAAVQPKVAAAALRLPPGFRLVQSGPGERLPEVVQRKMEGIFGADFSDVRVHTAFEAGAVGALALTRGSHIFFAPGSFAPATAHGLRLLGHELAHVVQQRAGRVKNQDPSAVVILDPRLEQEAERMGRRASQGPYDQAPHARRTRVLQRSSDSGSSSSRSSSSAAATTTTPASSASSSSAVTVASAAASSVSSSGSSGSDAKSDVKAAETADSGSAMTQSTQALFDMMRAYASIPDSDDSARGDAVAQMIEFTTSNPHWARIKRLKKPQTSTTVEARMQMLFEGRTCHTALAGGVAEILGFFLNPPD